METMPLSPGGQQPHSGVLSREAVAGPYIDMPPHTYTCSLQCALEFVVVARLESKQSSRTYKASSERLTVISKQCILFMQYVLIYLLS